MQVGGFGGALIPRCLQLSCWLLCMLCALCPISASAEQENSRNTTLPTRQTLEAAARTHDLANDPQWLNLVQYRPRFFGIPAWFGSSRLESLRDDPSYFLADNGKRDPQAELLATIAAFTKAPVDEQVADQDVACRFTARFAWLREKLSKILALPSSSIFAERSCPRFEYWQQSLAAHRITLVYPGSYLNNPASMFGHTLLRVDTKAQTEKTRMLAYAANYAAMTNEQQGAGYALKGLFGGYQGSITVEPYYKLIEKYSDREHRDIWEYQLRLDSAESSMLTAVLWEYASAYSDYYFLDENCSYQLLFLFEFLRPEFELLNAFPLWAIPSDTVKAVSSAPGLLAEVTYRPSAASILSHQLSFANPEVVSRAKQLAAQGFRGDISELNTSDDTMRAALELARTVLHYQRMRTRDQQERAQLAQHTFEVLQARAQFDTGAAFPPVPQPEVRPDQGHQTGRLRLGVGLEDEAAFTEFGARLAYHDHLDPSQGYVQGAAISVFQLDARWIESQGLRLEQFIPLEIESLAPRNQFVKPISWSLHTGVRRQRRSSDLDMHVAQIGGGPGLTYQLPDILPGEGIVWGLLQGELEYSGAFQHGNWAFGSGVRLGSYIDVARGSRLLIEASALRFVLAEEYTALTLSAAVRQQVAESLAAVLEIERESQLNNYDSTLMASLRWYW